MPAGANGKLYGAVTNLTVAEVLAKNGFEVERKKIEVPGLTIKSVGKYTVTIHLYEASTAEVALEVKPQDDSHKPADSTIAAKEEAPAAEEKAE
jgi:large subunit ribosomal protein L9